MTSTFAAWVGRSARPTADDSIARRLSDSVHCLTMGDHSPARALKLHDACELLADGFDGFDEHVRLYVTLTSGSVHESDFTDAQRFLDWLDGRVDLTDEQRDFVAVIRGRQTVELIAIRQRLAHARFQQLIAQSRRPLAEVDTGSRQTIHLNPVHVWSQFETRALLDDDADVPATVLFVPVGPEVRTVVVGTVAEDLLRDLERSGPARIADLLRRTPRHDRSTLLDVITDLAQAGVIALS